MSNVIYLNDRRRLPEKEEFVTVSVEDAIAEAKGEDTVREQWDRFMSLATKAAQEAAIWTDMQEEEE